MQAEITLFYFLRMGESSETVINDLYEISNILNTGMDRQTLLAAIQCIELGTIISNDSLLIFTFFKDS